MEYKMDACLQNYEKVIIKVMNLLGNIDKQMKQKIANSDDYKIIIEPRIYIFYQLHQVFI